MDIAKLVPIDAIPGLGAGATNAVVAIVFLILWRQYRGSHLLAFGLSFGGVAVAVLLGAVEHITGRLPWRDYIADGAYIGAGFLLFAGCSVLAGRRVPATALTIGAILTYIAAELILLTLGIPQSFISPNWWPSSIFGSLISSSLGRNSLGIGFSGTSSPFAARLICRGFGNSPTA